MHNVKLMLKIFENKVNIWAVLLLLVLGSVLSALIPPFQSPDEFDHIKRAYLLTKGQILLQVPQGKRAGGEIDTGLLSYFDGFQGLKYHRDKKISREDDFNVSSFKWSGKRVFSEAPGTGYYFPLVYAPQALGLGIGENLGLLIEHSYRLARLFTLAFSVIVLAVAFAVFPVNAFILGLLILPMSLFQFCSASLDAFTTALTVLCIALFMRACNTNFAFHRWMSYLLAGCILVLTTSRMHLLPLLILPLFVWSIRRDRVFLWQFLAVTVLSLAWLVVSIKSTYINRIASEFSTSQVIAFYAKHPSTMVDGLYNTLTTYAEFYRNSFIGILGWLDTRFDDDFYALIFNALILLAALSVSLKGVKDDWKPRAILVGLSLLSSVLIFFALLVTWNTVPAKIIEGVQGRYFIGPLIILGYALNGSAGFFDGVTKKIAIIPLLFIGVTVIFYFPNTLIERYYLSPNYGTPNENTDARFRMEPSPQLNARSSIKVLMTSTYEHEKTGLKRIGIMFATHGRENTGDAELHLKAPDGTEFVQRISLSDLADNRYHYFELDSNRYTSGEILYITGGGVSTWESHNEKGDVNTCIIYEYINRRRRFTPGCP